MHITTRPTTAFHEIQLSGKQLVFLFMATTMVVVVIFLCGVQVGRGVKARAGDAPETIAAALPRSTSHARNRPRPQRSRPPLSLPRRAKEDDLSYAKRLQAEAQPPEKVKAHVEATSAGVRARRGHDAAADAAPRADGRRAQGRASARAPRRRRRQSADRGAGSGRPGVWVVQVQALKDRRRPPALAQRLVGKGYPAFVLSPAAGAPSIYRVQVGRYNDRGEAEQIARRLEKEEQFKPWISH